MRYLIAILAVLINACSGSPTSVAAPVVEQTVATDSIAAEPIFLRVDISSEHPHACVVNARHEQYGPLRTDFATWLDFNFCVDTNAAEIDATLLLSKSRIPSDNIYIHLGRYTKGCHDATVLVTPTYISRAYHFDHIHVEVTAGEISGTSICSLFM